MRTVRRPLDAVLSELAQWYRARGLAARIQVPLPARGLLDQDLQRRGWTFREDVAVLTTRLDLLLGTARPDRPGLRIGSAPAPDSAWLGAYHYRGSDRLPSGAVELLARHDRVAFLSARHHPGGEVVAVARAVVDDEWLGVTAVDVAPRWRRRGVATALLVATARWAVGHGARRCYLQVSADNVAASALYTGLGFHQHHTYRYREAP